VKEPNFFNLDNKLGVATLEAYERLFRNASHHHAIRGEASVWQLTSPAGSTGAHVLVPGERHFQRRRQLDRIAEHHGKARIGLTAEEISRGTGSAGSAPRRVRLPMLSGAPRCFLHGGICSLATQFTRLHAAVREDRVSAVVFDLTTLLRTRGANTAVFQTFLGVENDDQNDLPILNRARMIPRCPALHWAKFIALQIKGRTWIRINLGLSGRLSRDNIVERRALSTAPFYRRVVIRPGAAPAAAARAV
jgi:hypothetical protein